jgi:DeoR C terminal sensor domain
VPDRYGPADLDCTVVTHSPTIAVELLGHRRIEVILLGGRVFKHSAVTCGAAAVEAAAGVSADVFLLGVTGVHPRHGLTTGDAEEAAMKRALARRAAETYVLASAEKLGAASRYGVLPLAEVAGVVTDGRPNETVRDLAAGGVPVLSRAGVSPCRRDSAVPTVGTWWSSGRFSRWGCRWRPSSGTPCWPAGLGGATSATRSWARSRTCGTRPRGARRS